MTATALESAIQGSLSALGVRLERAASGALPPLSGTELDTLRRDVKIETEAILKDYAARPFLKGLPPAPLLRDVLDIWFDAANDKLNYRLHPSDFYAVHKSIPSLLYGWEPYRD